MEQVATFTFLVAEWRPHCSIPEATELLIAAMPHTLVKYDVFAGSPF